MHPRKDTFMITIPMNTKGAMDRQSILSINISDPHSIQNRNTMNTFIQSHIYGQSTSPPIPRPSTVVPASPQQISPTRPNQIVQPAFTAGQQSQTAQPAFTSSQQHTNASTVVWTLPTLQNKVQKGQKSVLSSAPIDAVDACFGWNVTDTRCDVDVSAFLLGPNGKVFGDSWFVFYGQTLSPDQSTEFIPSAIEDREKIQVNLKKLDARIQKIVFVLTINDALTNHLHFGMIKDAYIRILGSSGKELVSFMMTEYYTNVISMMIGELYRHNGIWKFNAVGNGVAKDLAGLCSLYGVQTI